MACRRRVGRRAGLDHFLYLGRDDHRAADYPEADRRVRHLDPRAAHRLEPRRRCAPDEADDLRAAAALAPAGADPADGPPAWEPTA